jgi:hypothetical protein
MSREEFAARAIGEFLRIARVNANSDVHVLPYRELSVDRAIACARLWGFTDSDISPTELDREFSVYAKDRRRTAMFTPDSTREQHAATGEVRNQSRLWAQVAWEDLLSLDRA